MPLVGFPGIGGQRLELRLHAEPQDTSCDAWKQLLEMVDLVAAQGRDVFDPARVLGPDAWRQIITLPPSIAKLTRVRSLKLGSSALVRIPPEIGEMKALGGLDTYMSYQLHWYPYEITRCRNLFSSQVSTRALYGGSRLIALPFPRLPQRIGTSGPARCSVCRGPFGPDGPLQRWITLKVATDVLPLLVHACSNACIARLPEGAKGFARGPHAGGPGAVRRQ